jgi:hypothetical protein
LQPDKKATKELQISSSGFRSIVETFAIPHTFVEGIFKDQIWNGNGCFLGQTSDGLPGKFGTDNAAPREWTRADGLAELFYRSECGWHPHIQTAFVADFAANTATYLIIDCPEKVRDRIRNGIRSNPRLLDRPLVLDALLLDECLKAWNDKVNQYRRRLLEYVSRLFIIAAEHPLIFSAPRNTKAVKTIVPQLLKTRIQTMQRTRSTNSAPRPTGCSNTLQTWKAAASFFGNHTSDTWTPFKNLTTDGRSTGKAV